MNENLRGMLKDALQGDSTQWIMLAIIFKYGQEQQEIDEEFSKICLQQAIILENEEAYLLYHQWFTKGEKIIEDDSYEEMIAMYQELEKRGRSTMYIEQYLNLGTAEQKLQWKIHKDKAL